MVLSKNMQKLVAGSSTIRKLFEEGIELAKEVGAENVYDFSLGNPAAPVPEEVKKSIYDILENRNANPIMTAILMTVFFHEKVTWQKRILS